MRLPHEDIFVQLSYPESVREHRIAGIKGPIAAAWRELTAWSLTPGLAQVEGDGHSQKRVRKYRVHLLCALTQVRPVLLVMQQGLSLTRRALSACSSTRYG